MAKNYRVAVIAGDGIGKEVVPEGIAAMEAAARRYGFSFEGVFWQHMIVKGRNRDTAWFAMLDSEWPRRRKAFERWLDPGNFDTAGRQKVSLMSLNTEDSK